MRTVYVLTTLEMVGEGEGAMLVARNVGVTFSEQEAEAHRNEKVENDFQEFPAIDTHQDEDMSDFQTALEELAVNVRKMKPAVDAAIQRNINNENLRR